VIQPKMANCCENCSTIWTGVGKHTLLYLFRLHTLIKQHGLNSLYEIAFQNSVVLEFDYIVIVEFNY